MDEETKDFIQSLAATAGAQGFILEFLLRVEFSRLSQPDRLELAERLLDASQQTESYRGVAKDDFQAAGLADLLIDLQEKIGRMIGQALEAAAENEGSS